MTAKTGLRLIRSSFHRIPVRGVSASITALALCAFLGCAQAQAQTAAFCTDGTNLLVNGGGESDQAATGDGIIDQDVSNWVNETGEFTVVRYSAGGGYPIASSPGPANRGTFFFSG